MCVLLLNGVFILVVGVGLEGGRGDEGGVILRGRCKVQTDVCCKDCGMASQLARNGTSAYMRLRIKVGPSPSPSPLSMQRARTAPTHPHDSLVERYRLLSIGGYVSSGCKTNAVVFCKEGGGEERGGVTTLN